MYTVVYDDGYNENFERRADANKAARGAFQALILKDGEPVAKADCGHLINISVPMFLREYRQYDTDMLKSLLKREPRYDNTFSGFYINAVNANLSLAIRTLLRRRNVHGDS